MTKRIGLALAVVALAITGVQAQTSLSFGISRTSLSAVSGGAGTIGTAFTAPPGGDAALVTWVTSYSAPPASVTMLLQASLDNSTWFTLDSSTAVGGELRSIISSASFFRCNISAVSGAVNKTCSLVLRRTNSATSGTITAGGAITAGGDITTSGEFYASNGSAGAPSYSFTSAPASGSYVIGNSVAFTTAGVRRGYFDGGGLTIDGIARVADGTAGAPSYSFTSEPTLGFWRNGAGTIQAQGTLLGSGSIYAAQNASLNINGRFAISSTADGNARFTNTAGTDFGLLQFGGTTSAFPALKRSGALLHVRLADDSGYSSIVANIVYPNGLEFGPTLFANLVTPANGSFRYCSDCTITAVCAGSGTGAFAKRLNGVWVCN